MGILKDIWGVVSAKGKGKKAPDVLGTDDTQLGGSGQRFDGQGNPTPTGWYGYLDVPGRPGYTYAGLVYLGKPSQEVVQAQINKSWEARKVLELRKVYGALGPLTAPRPSLMLAPTDATEAPLVDADTEADTRRNLQRNLALGAAAALTILVLSR